MQPSVSRRERGNCRVLGKDSKEKRERMKEHKEKCRCFGVSIRVLSSFQALKTMV